ncbi:MAG: OsmC family protein [Candidatus Heimdallarchaeota archaeon]
MLSKKMANVDQKNFTVDLNLIKNFQFNVKFDMDVPGLLLDEPADAGGDGKGPNASRLIGAAVGNCLSASLLFCLRKAKVDVTGIRTLVKGIITRNKEGYWRIQQFEVNIQPNLHESEQSPGFERCKGLFENYCIATESVRQGIPVNVTIVPKRVM